MTFDEARDQMVETQLQARGISDLRVLRAMRTIPRHLFVGPALQQRAYDDSPLPIDAEQTISQPYMVALMSELLALTGAERVLEIGTGSGYQAAVLGQLAAEIFTVERIDALAQCAGKRLEALGDDGRVHVRVADGCDGWADAAPFDAIVVAAAVQHVPRPLVEQLGDGGRLVLPLGEEDLQGLARIRKERGGLQVDYFGECRFVKLIGQYGWEG
jgi:protein-L-isoaspartate(D-aspartate) O-methyltransferase